MIAARRREEPDPASFRKEEDLADTRNGRARYKRCCLDLQRCAPTGSRKKPERWLGLRLSPHECTLQVDRREASSGPLHPQLGWYARNAAASLPDSRAAREAFQWLGEGTFRSNEHSTIFAVCSPIWIKASTQLTARSAKPGHQRTTSPRYHSDTNLRVKSSLSCCCHSGHLLEI